MYKLFIPLLAITLVSGCTHKKLEVNRVGDTDLSCNQVAAEIVDIELLLRDIDDKTGFSGRNVGMGILFWPGVIVNEVNANSAEGLAHQRLNKLVGMFEEKKCTPSLMAKEEVRLKEEAEKKEPDIQKPVGKRDI